MAVQIVSSYDASTGSGSSRSFNFTATGGSGSILIVAVSTYDDGPGAITFNGDSLTLKTYQTSSYNSSSLWYRLSPDSGTHSISITGMASSTYNIVGVIELSGVDESNPFDDFESKTGTGYTCSVNLTPSIGGSCAVDCVALEALWSSGLTVGANQTSIYNRTAGTNLVRGGMSYETNSGTSDTTMSWTWGGTFTSTYCYSTVLVKAGSVAVSEFETISIQESVSRSTSIPDQFETEAISISEYVKILLTGYINKYDSIGISEDSVVEVAALKVNVNDQVGVSDVDDLFIPFFRLSVTEDLNVIEFTYGEKDPKEIVVVDAITINEVVVGGDTKFKDFDDSITITDTVLDPKLSYTISVFDNITYGDTASIVRIFTVNVYSGINVEDGWIDTTTIRWGRSFPMNRPKGFVDLF